MKRKLVGFLSVLFLVALSACGSFAPVPALTPTHLTPDTSHPSTTLRASLTPSLTPLPPTETPAPTATIAPEIAIEQAYRQTLTPEQLALFDQSSDLTHEGLARSFLENDLSHYLAYFDRDGEVAYVWNPEQMKTNPALKIDNNLLINEASASHIVWNPELDREQAKKTLSDYFKYARARVCAAGTGAQLPKTLDAALADPKAQGFLEKGCRVTLNNVSDPWADYPYDVPAQTIDVSGQIGFVIRFTDKRTEDMIVRNTISNDGVESVRAYTHRQSKRGYLEFMYFHSGIEDLSDYPEFKSMILSRRISNIFSSLFSRAAGTTATGLGDLDPLTQTTIFNPKGLNTVPLIIYTNLR